MNLRPVLSATLLMSLSVTLAAPFVSKTNGYSITPPATWKKLKVSEVNKGSGVEISFAAAPKNNFATNFNLTVNPATGVQKIPDNAFLKALGDEVQSDVSTMPGFKLISRKNDTLSGQPAINLVYYGPNKLQLSQYFTVYKEKAYVLTFVSQSSEYAGQLATFTGIKNSFKLK